MTQPRVVTDEEAAELRTLFPAHIDQSATTKRYEEMWSALLDHREALMDALENIMAGAESPYPFGKALDAARSLLSLSHGGGK